MKKFAVLGALALALLVIALRGTGPSTTVLTGQAMGCSWKLACSGEIPASLPAEVAAELERWEQVLSQWRPDSDLSRHNRGEAATPDLQRVIALTEKIQVETGPAFDIQYSLFNIRYSFAVLTTHHSAFSIAGSIGAFFSI